MTYTDAAIREHLAREYGIAARSLEHFSGGKVNSSFHVVGDAYAYVFRIYEAKSAQMVACEVAILDALQAADFPSQTVVKTASGAALTDFFGKPAILVSHIPGAPATGLGTRELRTVGQLLARIHILPLPQCLTEKPTWEPEPLRALFNREKENFCASGVRHASHIAHFFEEHHQHFSFPAELPKGVTHQDIKKENVILHNEAVQGIIDFDNAYYGSFIHDIATTVIWECYSGERLSAERVDALLKGYQSIRPLADIERSHLVSAIRHRLLREVFISPYAAVKERDAAAELSLRFMRLFDSFGETEERVIVEGVTT
jgi:homoserine kinase type II